MVQTLRLESPKSWPNLRGLLLTAVVLLLAGECAWAQGPGAGPKAPPKAPLGKEQRRQLQEGPKQADRLADLAVANVVYVGLGGGAGPATGPPGRCQDQRGAVVVIVENKGPNDAPHGYELAVYLDQGDRRATTLLGTMAVSTPLSRGQFSPQHSFPIPPEKHTVPPRQAGVRLSLRAVVSVKSAAGGFRVVDDNPANNDRYDSTYLVDCAPKLVLEPVAGTGIGNPNPWNPTQVCPGGRVLFRVTIRNDGYRPSSAFVLNYERGTPDLRFTDGATKAVHYPKGAVPPRSRITRDDVVFISEAARRDQYLFVVSLREPGTQSTIAALASGVNVDCQSFTRELYPIFQHPRCVNCHGRVDGSTGANHRGGTQPQELCSGCHRVQDWRNAARSAFWSGSGTAARSALDICRTVKNSPEAQSRQSFLHHVGVGNDHRIAWAFSPTGIKNPSAIGLLPPLPAAPGDHANFQQKSMAWFDANKPCP